MRFIESQRDVIDTLRNPRNHSSTERKRAYMFLFVYILGAIAFGCSMLHFVSAWVAALIVQLVQLIFVLLYSFNVNDYSDRTVSAMECERACNPVIDGYIALRVLQVCEGVFMRSYVATVCFVACLVYTVWRVRRGKVYVDATNLWREIGKVAKESYLFVAMDVILLVVILVAMIFSLIYRYS